MQAQWLVFVGIPKFGRHPSPVYLRFSRSVNRFLCNQTDLFITIHVQEWRPKCYTCNREIVINLESVTKIDD